MSGVDEKSLKGFAYDLEKSRTTLAYEGIFVILDVLDKQREVLGICFHTLLQLCQDNVNAAVSSLLEKA